MNESKTPSDALSYFVLLYCLLVPAIGTLVSVILMDHISEELALAGTICVYLSSITLGVLNLKMFKEYRDRLDFWALITGIILCGICCLVAIGALILRRAAVELHIH